MIEPGLAEVEREHVRLPRPQAGEEGARRLAEDDGQRAPPRAQALARAQVEGHVRPAPVVDERLERDKRLGLRVRGHALLVEVAGVAAAHDPGRVERPHRLEHLHLLVDERLRRQRHRRLHRREAEHLEQMRDDHVAKRARGVVEGGARADRERLRHVELDVVDVVAVPDRLEEAVREPQREHVLHGLLAEEVVDAEDLLLGEDAVHDGVQRAGRLEVGPERLLHDHACAVGEARGAERLDDPGHGLRRHGEVVQASHLAADRVLGALRRGGELVAGTDVRGRVGEVRRELVPARAGLEAAELLRRLPGEGAELVVAERAPRGADDPVPPREQAGLEEVVEAGEELPLGEVAGRAEEDDHVVVWPCALDPQRRHGARDDRHPPPPPRRRR